jgi:biopolymer transport protein ExbD
MSAGGGEGQVKSDINVTPLVDVVLVLLIIFMVVTPMLQKGKDVLLPVTDNPKQEKSDDENEILVSITKDKLLYIDTDPVTEDGLLQKMTETFERNPGKLILIKGDRRLTFGDVKDIMLRINEAGFTNVSVLADKREGAGASGQ